MIPKFVERAIAELKAMWPEEEHFPTLEYSGGYYRLKSKRHYFRMGKCPLKLYSTEIAERQVEYWRKSEENVFIPGTPFDALTKWYKDEWYKITLAFETICDAETDSFLFTLKKGNR